MNLLAIPSGQPRLDRATLPALSARLTERDYQILTHLHRHRVLTTHQIQRIFFGIPQSTRKRMRTLYLLNAVTGFRPWAGYGAGSAPVHWALGKAGAHALAARHGIDVKDLGYDPDTKISFSSRLNHHVGVNDFFSHLHHYARQVGAGAAREPGSGTGAALKAWWSEQECTKQWGDLARPDAWARWREDGNEIDFFLEHDTGTETLKRVTDKLHDYRDLADDTAINTPILLWLPNPIREANLRHLLTATDLPVATAVHTHDGDGPAGPIWLPAPATAGQQRMRLADLAHAWPHLPLGRIQDPPTNEQDRYEDGSTLGLRTGDEAR
ncbi:replication-relaxation family protein [Nonomuraea typhae]|uniref:replication-relaxation family protein n=1 Tax=Nonomuraea typhae TaxID=2603600 RepID=UPI0012FA5CDA|nr:replication-relaxation family protein [Nonomuraea typhae]